MHHAVFVLYDTEYSIFIKVLARLFVQPPLHSWSRGLFDTAATPLHSHRVRHQGVNPRLEPVVDADAATFERDKLNAKQLRLAFGNSMFPACPT